MSSSPNENYAPSGGFILLGEAKELTQRVTELGFAVVDESGVDGCCAVIDISKNTADAVLLTEMETRPGAVLAIINNEDKASIIAAAGAGATHIIAAPVNGAILKAQLTAIDAFLVKFSAPIGQTGKDSLTGLSNSFAARERLQAWLDSGEEDISAIMCGLRRFEMVNTAFGSASGDIMLETLAQRVQSFVHEAVGENALVARLGGRDFLIATHAPIDRRHWQFIAAELLELVSQPVMVEGETIRLTARASLAKAARDEDAGSYVGRLTSALKQAQRQGDRNVKWADRTADGSPEHGYQLETDLMRAIERDQIKISFQPQFAVDGGGIIGAEALARWEHHEFGEIGAAVLFALAERTDFTEHLSAHIGMLAMQQAAKWPGIMSDLRLSLNVTAEELASPRFMETLRGALGMSGFDARKLTLEITESALIGNLKGAAELLSALRALGIKIAIDDFGTGYSNFLYLKSLPLDYIKLDHAMTGDIAGSARDRVIVRSIIALAQSLELEVIAEGVETEEQLAALQGEGCQYYQGFLRARALMPQDFEAFVRANR